MSYSLRFGIPCRHSRQHGSGISHRVARGGGPTKFRTWRIAQRVVLLAAVTTVGITLSSCEDPSVTSVDTLAPILQLHGGHDQVGTVGQELPDPIVVRVVDERGRSVRGQVINFHVTSGGGSVSAATAITNEDGFAQERWTLGLDASEEQSLEARAGDAESGDRSSFATFHAEAHPGDAAALIVSPSDARLEVGDTIEIEVDAEDEHGNEIQRQHITWSSSDPEVATVSDEGEVAAIGIGMAEIVARSGELADTVAVEVVGDEDHHDPPSTGAWDRVVENVKFDEDVVVPAGERWLFGPDVQTEANVVVRGTLGMRPGSSLRFVNVDESRMVGGGMDFLKSDVGLWVLGEGVLDIQGTPKQSWNRTGTHGSWSSSDEYMRTPHAKGEWEAQPWNPGDPVPCVDFAGNSYCAEILNLTRDIKIEGTERGRAHIFLRSTQPQTIRYAAIRWMGPELDDETPDGRYALHFHHAGDGSRGSLIEGVIIRDTHDHAYSPHESHGIEFVDVIALNVRNTAYWWDQGDRSDDIGYRGAIAVGVSPGRDSAGSLSGFRMGTGVGNACIGCVAAGVRDRRTSNGFAWREGTPNRWLFEDNVVHNSEQAIYHWQNEPHDGHLPPHEHSGLVAYHNNRFGIEQGAYTNSAHWYDLVIFGNRSTAIRNRGAPRHTENDPGILYSRGTLGGGSDRSGHVIEMTSMRNCGRDSQIVWEDLHLLDWSLTPIRINHEECASDDGQFDVVFRHVVVGDEKRDLERADFTVEAIPPGGRITVVRTDGTTFTITEAD